MKPYSGDNIKNVAILGHSGSGKTSLTEAILFSVGATTRLGKTTDGNTASDYDAEEIRRKVSIGSSLIPVEWQNDKFNFIDTPGYFDFVGEVNGALRVADVALIVVNAKSGIEVGTEKAWDYAEKMKVPKVIFVNGMDDADACLDTVVDAMKERFGKSIAPVQLPYRDDAGKFAGYVNITKLEGRKYENGRTIPCEIPPGLDEQISAMRDQIFEAVAESSDELMEKYFNEEEFTAEEIQAGLKVGVTNGSVTPVFCGSATMNIGTRVLLNSLDQFVPSASTAYPEITVTDAKTGDEIVRKCADSEPFSAFVFKTIADPYVGRLNLFRVFSGVLKKDAMVYNPKKDVMEKLSHLYIMKGKEQIPVTELRAGDIGAVAKLSNTGTQDTLCDKASPIIISETELPKSIFKLAIVPKTKGDEDKISQSLSKLMEEDLTLKFEVNSETKQSLVYGVGETQHDVILAKLKNKYKLDAEFVMPIVPYRETIKAKVKQQGKYKKQSGGRGQYGDVWIEFEPSFDLSGGYVFEEKIFGGSVPREYYPAVEKGIQECIRTGVLAGYPVVGLKATLVDGSYHDVDSSEMAFKMATSAAFKEGLPKAKPVLLEPIGKAEVTVPDDYTGDIMGDMNKRRGRILGMTPLGGGKQRIEAEVPVSEMTKYATDLRSMTGGRGEFDFAFDRYEEAPADVQKAIIDRAAVGK